MVINKPWNFSDDQTITIKDRRYNVHAAISLSQDLEIKDLPLDDFNICYNSPCDDNLRDFIAHCRLVIEADLSYPILLNQDGALIDGKHRLCRAILDGHKTIKARRFISDPSACWRYVS